VPKTAGLQHQQTLSLQSQQPQLNNLAYDAHNCLLLLGNAEGSMLVALHLAAGANRFDSYAQFEVTIPIVSLEARSLLPGSREATDVQVTPPPPFPCLDLLLSWSGRMKVGCLHVGPFTTSLGLDCTDRWGNWYMNVASAKTSLWRRNEPIRARIIYMAHYHHWEVCAETLFAEHMQSNTGTSPRRQTCYRQTPESQSQKTPLTYSRLVTTPFPLPTSGCL